MYIIGGTATVNITGGPDLNDFNHFDLTHSLQNYLGNSIDSNPYTDSTLNSKFFNTDEIIAKFSKSKLPLILNLKIQSLYSKFDMLNCFLYDLNKAGIFIIAITLQEIWQIVDPNTVQIDNFSFYFSCRKKGRGGGVGIYINNDLSASPNKNLSLFNENIFESISIDFKYKNKTYTISSIYRPPNNSATITYEYFSFFEQFLIKSSNILHTHFLLSDSNFNLLKIQSCKNSQTYLNLIHNYGYLQHISKATRIQGNTFSLIDHICSKNEPTNLTSGVISTDISDHFTTFISFNNPTPSTAPRTIQSRDFSPTNILNFKIALSNISWDNVLVQTDVNIAFNEFWETFHSTFNLYFPLITKKLNRNFHKLNDFLTKGLLTSRKTKNTLHKKSILEPTTENINKFRNYRNIYNSLICKSKILTYHQKLQNNIKNPRKTWEIFNEVIGKKQKNMEK